jgi:hypothetical protein
VEALAVSTFYVLPPRPLLGEYFAGYLGTFFPGLDWTNTGWTELANILETATAQHVDVYVVFREDLPDGEELARALIDGFGAEVGDRIIEVRPGSKPGELAARRWRLGDTPELSKTIPPLAG